MAWSAGGISSVSFSATGEHCLTAGLDGAVLLHTMQESGQAHLSQLPVQAPALGDAQDMDILDDDAEATEVCALLHHQVCSSACSPMWESQQTARRHASNLKWLIGSCFCFVCMSAPVFLDSFFHSFFHSFILICIRLFIHSCVHSGTGSLVHSSTP